MSANAWFLDGFSPAKNPNMWTAGIMERLADLSAPGARVSTFTVAGAVRLALTRAGFVVEKKEGFGRKRHRLEAHLPGEERRFSYTDLEPPVIIGGGIAGQSLAKAFLRHGIKPALYEDPQHIAASGNPAALIKPRLDLQDRPESRFFLNSYLYALETYQDAVLSAGIRHIPKSVSEAARYQKLLQQNALGDDHLEAAEESSVLFPRALTISPIKYKESVSELVEIQTHNFKNIPAERKSYFLAAGYGIKNLIPEWPLRFSRGQITYIEKSNALSQATSYGGYAIPLDDNSLLGATHARLTEGIDPFTLNIKDDAKNLEQFEQHTGEKPTQNNQASRASVRVTSANTLPVIGQTEDGHFVLTGLGSRGFVFAPLLAEAIVSHFLGDPLPIAKSVWEKFSVKRLFN